VAIKADATRKRKKTRGGRESRETLAKI